MTWGPGDFKKGSRFYGSSQCQILPYLEQGPVANSINFAASFSLPANLARENITVASTTIATFACPSDGLISASPYACQSYRINQGLGEFRTISWMGRPALGFVETGAFGWADEILPLSAFADRLAKELGSWTSVEYRLHQDFRREAAIPPGASLYASYREDIRYVETGLGQRYYEIHSLPNPPHDETFSVDYCDGKLAANFFRRPGQAGYQDQVIIKRTFAQENAASSCRPYPFNTYYVGDQPIDRAVSMATPLGTSRYLGRVCDRLLFSTVGNKSEFVYDLDAGTSQPLRILNYSNESARLENRPLGTWATEAVEQIDGHPVVTRFESLNNDTSPGGGHVEFRIRAVVDEVKFDQSYPKEMFWPKITAETKVFDLVKNTRQFPRTKPVAKVKTSTGTPIPADAGEGNLPVAGIVLVLGLLLIVGAVVFSRRRA